MNGLKHDKDKLRYSLVPPEAIKALAEVLTYGAKKYEANNWQKIENAEERYIDALYRHLEAYRAGYAIDEESHLHHLDHAITNLAFLIWFREQQRSLIIDSDITDEEIDRMSAAMRAGKLIRTNNE